MREELPLCPFPFLSLYMPAAWLSEALRARVVWMLGRPGLVKVYAGGGGDRPLDCWCF